MIVKFIFSNQDLVKFMNVIENNIVIVFKSNKLGFYTGIQEFLIENKQTVNAESLVKDEYQCKLNVQGLLC